MTEQAADWSEHDLDRRFALGEPHDELTRLAATLDSLLATGGGEPAARAALLVRDLARAADAADKVRGRGRACAAARRDDDSYREALRRVLAGADQMARIIDTLLAVAREEAGERQGTADACRGGDSCSRELRRGGPGRGRRIEVSRSPATPNA